MENKTIIITGGTSGIGYELTKLLYKSNRLIIIAKNSEKLNSLKKEFDVCIYQADLSNLTDVKNVSNKIVSNFNSIDILINNAGVQFPQTYLDENFEYNNIEKEINTNLTSICSFIHTFIPLLKHEKTSTILNVNSGLALAPKSTSAVYCATKAALNIFTQSLRYQLEQTNINVFQVFLPLVDTNMTRGRGKNKVSPKYVAEKIIYGIENNIQDHDIGKVKFLRVLLRFFPVIAKNIMKKY